MCTSNMFRAFPSPENPHPARLAGHGGWATGVQLKCSKNLPMRDFHAKLLLNIGLNELRDLWLLTLNHRVGGSSPSQRTFYNFPLTLNHRIRVQVLRSKVGASFHMAICCCSMQSTLVAPRIGACQWRRLP